MANLSSKQINNTFKDILNINGIADNEGLETNLKTIQDGEGIASALSLSTTEIGIRGNFLTDSVTEFVFKVTDGSTGDVFKVDVGSQTAFTIQHQGTVVLRNQTSAPTPIAGGLYFKDNIFYVGSD